MILQVKSAGPSGLRSPTVFLSFAGLVVAYIQPLLLASTEAESNSQMRLVNDNTKCELPDSAGPTASSKRFQLFRRLFLSRSPTIRLFEGPHQPRSYSD